MEGETSLNLDGAGCSYVAAGEQNRDLAYASATDGNGVVEDLAYATATEGAGLNTYAEVGSECPYEENPYLEPMRFPNGGELERESSYIEVDQRPGLPRNQSNQSLRPSQTLPRIPGGQSYSPRHLGSIEEVPSQGGAMYGNKYIDMMQGL